jgi:hypothetical protein
MASTSDETLSAHANHHCEQIRDTNLFMSVDENLNGFVIR